LGPQRFINRTVPPSLTCTVRFGLLDTPPQAQIMLLRPDGICTRAGVNVRWTSRHKDLGAFLDLVFTCAQAMCVADFSFNVTSKLSLDVSLIWMPPAYAS